jgi:D-glycero-D-manno-heptose 1,7-bisphosphate phosphatase
MNQVCGTDDKVKQRGFFFDRDGILNKVILRGKIVGSPRQLSEFHPFTLTKSILEHASTKGVVVVVTNQPDIASGLLKEQELEKMHSKLQNLSPSIKLILWEGSNLPDHPRRKPRPHMLLEASQTLRLNPSISWMIGDSDKDIQAGKSAGCRTVLLQTEYNRSIHGSGDVNLNSHEELLTWLEKLP